ncbi:hypothetical protein D3C76_1147880 [compost metagenome]
MGGVDGQVETYPGLAIAFETLDVAGTQGRGFRAGIEFGSHFQVDTAQGCVFVEAIDGLFPRHGKTWQAKTIKECGEGLESHKSWCAAVRISVQGPGIAAQAPS